MKMQKINQMVCLIVILVLVTTIYMPWTALACGLHDLRGRPCTTNSDCCGDYPGGRHNVCYRDASYGADSCRCLCRAGTCACCALAGSRCADDSDCCYYGLFLGLTRRCVIPRGSGDLRCAHLGLGRGRV